MKDNLDIEKLFKDRFEAFEPEVNASAWQNIATSMSAGSAASSGFSLLKSIIIGGAAVTTIAVGSWLYVNSDNDSNDVAISEKIESNHSNTSIDQTEQTNYSEPEEYVAVNTNKNTLEESPEEVLTEELVAPISEESSQDDHIVEPSDVPVSSQIPNDQQKEEGQDVLTTASDQKTDLSKTDMTMESTIDEASNTAENPSTDAPKETNDKNNDVSLERVDNNESITPEIDSELKSFIKIVPNVITPNNDRVNDEFFIESENIEEFYIMIYSKANIKLFESSDPNFKWDGFDMRGQKVPRADYYYLIKAVGKDKVPYSLPGQLRVQ